MPPPKLPQAPPGQDPTGPHYGYGDLPHGGPGPALGTGDFEDNVVASSGDDPYIPPTTTGTGLEVFPKKIIEKGKSIIDSVVGSTLYGQIIGGIGSGFQATNNFFKKLASGEALNPEDKIILANLIAANKENPNVLGDWEKYAEKFNVSDAKGFKSSLDEAISDLENTDYQSLIDKYLARKPEGMESLTTMVGDLGNLAMGTSPEYHEAAGGQGILTLENLKKE